MTVLLSTFIFLTAKVKLYDGNGNCAEMKFTVETYNVEEVYSIEAVRAGL